MQMYNVAIVDPHPLASFGLRHLVEGQLKAQVVYEGSSPEEIKNLAGSAALNLVILDPFIEGNFGLQLVQELLEIRPELVVVVVSQNSSNPHVIHALGVGARGVINKHSAIEELYQAVEVLRQGAYYVSGHGVQRNPVSFVNGLRRTELLRNQEHEKLHNRWGFTPREYEVIRCITETYSNRDIAKLFTISEETVKRHLSNIFDKSGVSTRLELAMWAIAHNVLMHAPAAVPRRLAPAA